ncbi:VanZ family protein [Peribacillus psychrosaccharolyticus]|uniref:VanZ family protein n=1 Tax=Peribacillus psychrosaccharolyticus TaxID=1407 RepID=A0A974S0T8_PERPY|nr:VanZ family protein [Peribacillus psychrosaccharolyticus]MEC2056103.1 VanZ family protein [Peribacillus psychrosaccharolyticus]MED3745544.1 VanZ family protein [Peribacillus psychrosaccharolyticus]QQT00703.1 VanZ family protein [Peribacillus psychrosaccharolyticus]
MQKILTISYWAILLFYLLLLTYTVFIGRDSIRSVNLIPFDSIKNFIMVDNGIGGTRIIDMNIWGNILMFIPAGIYLILQHTTKSIAKNLFYIFLFSLFIEVVQYVFTIGATDVDDVILNVAGGFMGLMIYKIAEKIFKNDMNIKKAISILSLIVGLPIFVLVTILFIAN